MTRASRTSSARVEAVFRPPQRRCVHAFWINFSPCICVCPLISSSSRVSTGFCPCILSDWEIRSKYIHIRGKGAVSDICMSDNDVIISGFAAIIDRKLLSLSLRCKLNSGSALRKGRIVNLYPGLNSICLPLASGKARDLMFIRD